MYVPCLLLSVSCGPKKSSIEYSVYTCTGMLYVHYGVVRLTNIHCIQLYRDLYSLTLKVGLNILSVMHFMYYLL